MELKYEMIPGTCSWVTVANSMDMPTFPIRDEGWLTFYAFVQAFLE